MSHSSLVAAQSALLNPHGLDETGLTHTLDHLLARGVDYADLYFQARRSESWRLDEGIVKAGDFSITQGVGVRAVAGERTALAFSDDLSLRALTQAADATRAIAYATGGTRSVEVGERPVGVNARELYLANDPLDSLKAADKVNMLERIDRMARARDPRIQQVMASIIGSHEIVLVARSDGQQMGDIRPMVRVSIQVVAVQNGRREIATAGGGGRVDYGYFTEARLARYVDLAVNRALTNLEARPAPAGTMPIVLGPGWPGILLHEAIGHGLEGDYNRKGASAFAGRMGERVAAKGVTVVDDGTLPERRGSLTMDDEGNPAQCTTLIEDGILTGYMQDMLNARLMKMPITGNGRRESYAALPLPRMTNTYMLNGDKDPLEIVASVKRGLYAVDFSGGQVDITNGKFVFSATEAYMIEDGKLTYPVKGATLIGSGPESLKYVSMIGNDMALDAGVAVCGKEGQNVPVGVGQPTLLIDQMTVGGTAT
jgi:TldD protein